MILKMSVVVNRVIYLNRLSHFQIYYASCINVRNFGQTQLKKDENKNINNEIPKVKPFSSNGDRTWVGPPHPVSNLRLKVFPSKYLTKEEAHFYTRSKEIQDWNQEYWITHNKDFEQSKKIYIERKTKEKHLDANTSLNTEEMAEFYRDFLNKNYDKHLIYNWQWYKKNFELLYLSAKAKISKLRKLVK